MNQPDSHDFDAYMRQLALVRDERRLPQANAIWAAAELRRQWERRQTATRWIRRAYAIGAAACAAAGAIGVLALQPRWSEVAAALHAWGSVLALAAAASVSVTLVSAMLARRLTAPPRR